MSTFTQWVHQHNLMLLIVAVLVLTSFVLLHHPRSRVLWGIVAGLVVSCLVAAIALHTPSASITEHRRSKHCSQAGINRHWWNSTRITASLEHFRFLP
jgi:uncharacterized membrane protein